MTQSHTQTPWYDEGGEIYEASVGRIALMDCENRKTLPVERDENAKFIVHAVNSHDDLRATLRNLVTLLKDGRQFDFTDSVRERHQAWIDEMWHARRYADALLERIQKETS